MRSRRWGVALAMLLLGAFATPLAAQSACEGLETTRRGATGTWTAFAQPDFADEVAEVAAHAVDPGDARRWWVTDGVELFRSSDGGCSWQKVFTLPDVPTPDVPASRQTDRIAVLAARSTGDVLLSIAVGASAPGGAFLGGDDGDAGDAGGATVVVAGEDSFRALAPLAAPAGAPGPLVPAPSDPQVVYAVAGGVVNASRDGGASWRIASPPSEPVRAGVGGLSFDSRDTFPGVSGLAVDPLDAQAVWARQREEVFSSTDGGAGYRSVLDAGSGTSLPLLGAARAPGGPARVTVGEQADPGAPLRALRISDGGAFQVRPTTNNGIGLITGSGQSLAVGPGRSDLVLTTSGGTGRTAGVYAYVPAADRLVAVDEFGLGPLLDAQVTRLGQQQAYAFRRVAGLVRWVPRVLTAPRLPAPVPELEVPPAGGLGPLSGATRVRAPARISIPPGQTRTVPLTLDLAAEPTPLDVFFVLDTSGSMNDVIDGLAEGFAELSEELAARGIDARYGLGDYQDTNAVRYRRLVDISPPGKPLREALGSIGTAGGAEPAYTALHQIATGSGILDPQRGQPVPVGEDASWRGGSLRVVVHATDEVPSGDPDGADRDTAVAALNADRARHIGIEVVRDAVRRVSDSSLVPPGELNDILRGLSRDTGALAPLGGVDCDADGRPDVDVGEPLVCELVPGGGRLELAGPLLNVLSSLVDEQPVGIAVGPRASADGLSARLTRFSGAARVDVKRPHTQDYGLELTCPTALAGTTRELRLRPAVGQRVGRVTPLTVACEPLPAAPRVAAPAPPPVELTLALPPAPAVLVAALPPPPPPPAPAGAPAPAPAPAGAPAPAVAPVPGVAVAPADQELELALAFADPETDEQLAMVDRRPRPDLLALRMLSLVLICSAVTGAALRRRPSVRRSD